MVIRAIKAFCGHAVDVYVAIKTYMTSIEEAKKLLISDGLQETLERYGSVLPTGSYALDLMTWRDLDLYFKSVK